MADQTRTENDAAHRDLSPTSPSSTKTPGLLMVPRIAPENPQASLPGNPVRNPSVGTVASQVSQGNISATSTAVDLAELEGPRPRPTIKHHQGIYWRSPISMVSFLLFGVLASVSHHFYYSSLDGKQVGNDRQQQWSLRFEVTSFHSHRISSMNNVPSSD